eukprot:GAHX01000424.1.p1 GENE.GAHX01000424.1~~GAHX01000424.1.p1  ORF type:complete len:286 (+),score=69.44 GAHX01000424.1:124-981(+)
MTKMKINLSRFGETKERKEVDNVNTGKSKDIFYFDGRFLKTPDYHGEIIYPVISTADLDYSYIFKPKPQPKKIEQPPRKIKTSTPTIYNEPVGTPLFNKEERVLVEHKAKIKSIGKVSKNFKKFLTPTLFERKVKEVEEARNENHDENNIMRKLTDEQKHNRKLSKLEKELKKEKAENLVHVKNIGANQVQSLKRKLKYITQDRMGNSTIYFCKEVQEVLVVNEGSNKTIKRTKRAFNNLCKDKCFSDVVVKELWEQKIENIKGCFVNIVYIDDLNKFKNKLKYH